MELYNYSLSKYVDDVIIENINNLSISDDNTNSKNIFIIEKYFPYSNNVKYNNLKIDNIGKFSITHPKQADEISLIIKNYFNKKDNNPIIITDAMAGVGGNVLSFCRTNFNVNAIEKDFIRYNFLINNINEYKLNNRILKLYNDNYLNVYNKIIQDVIYIDPPWGGAAYKNIEHITIKIDNIEIEDLCNNIIINKLASLIVLKLPINYDLNYIKIKISYSFLIFKLKNILLILIFNN